MSTMVLLVAALVPVVIGLHLARSPISAAAFATRHGITLTPGNWPVIDSYLAHTRRWRGIGALAGYLAGLATSLGTDRTAFEFVPVLAGWFAGAVFAEFRFEGQSDPARDPLAAVPGWLLRVPRYLAAITAGVTGLLLLLGRGDGPWGRILGWGAVALAVAVVVAVTDRHVLRRSAPVFAADAIGAITGGGTALVVWCLATGLSVLGFFDAAATAVAGIGVVWIIGGLRAGWLLATAAWGRRTVTPLLLVAAVVVAISGGWAGYAWWTDHPPYPATAVRATAVLRLTDDAHFDQDARALGITGLNHLDLPDSQQFIGRVDHVRPAGANGHDTYRVIVIDKRQNRLARELYDQDGGGWNSFMSDLAVRYTWLSATAPQVSAFGYTFHGSEVARSADSPEPITFVGRFPGTALRSPADLMVVLVLTGPDQQIYWATRIAG